MSRSAPSMNGSAVVQVTPDFPLDFPSAVAVGTLRDIHARIVDLKEKRSAAQRKLNATRQNTGAIEATGGDPVKAIHDATTELQQIESKVAGAQHELVQAFLVEQQKYAQMHRGLWARLYNEELAPLAEKFSNLAGDFEQLITDVDELLKADTGSSADLAAFVARIAAWNDIVHELNGPGNAEINSAISVEKSVADSLAQNHGIIKRFDNALGRLRGLLYPQPPIPKMLTEEEIAKRREDAWRPANYERTPGS